MTDICEDPECPRKRKKLANDPVQEKYSWNGIPIDIEWPSGSVRKYVDSDYRVQMYCDYGYIRGTDSIDGEEVDVYVGPDKSSKRVFIITQLVTGTWEGKVPGTYDEDKVMLGFSDEEEARHVYILHTSERHFGGIDELTLKEFKDSYLKEAKE